MVVHVEDQRNLSDGLQDGRNLVSMQVDKQHKYNSKASAQTKSHFINLKQWYQKQGLGPLRKRGEDWSVLIVKVWDMRLINVLSCMGSRA